MKQTRVIGVINTAKVNPGKNKKGEFRPYILLVVRTTSGDETIAINRNFIASNLEGIIDVPTIEYGAKGVNIPDLLYRGVELDLEETIKGVTTYTNSDGETVHHNRDGRQVTSFKLLSPLETTARQLNSILSSGLSVAAVEMAAKSETEVLIERMRLREDRMAKRATTVSNTVSATDSGIKFTAPVDETDEGDDHTDDDGGSDPEVDKVLDQVTEDAKSAKSAKPTK